MDSLDEVKNAIACEIRLETDGAFKGLKRAIRSIAFKALEPFISNQQAINISLLHLLESHSSELAMRRAGSRAEAIQTTELLREIRILNLRVESLQELMPHNKDEAKPINGETNQQAP